MLDFEKGGVNLKIYEKVRGYMDARGIKHSVIARHAGIPPKTFSAMMCGKRIMYADDFESICHALGVCANEFIEIPANR